MTMDKEAQKKTLANELYMLDNGKHSIDYDAWAGRLILNGYCKLPKDKLPLITAANLPDNLLDDLEYGEIADIGIFLHMQLRDQMEADSKYYGAGGQ